MFVEMHLIQNFAPSNLNRDDTGSPKDCEFGGFRRARISSQCLKRAIRTEFRERPLLGKDLLAKRTKRLSGELVTRLTTEGHHDPAEAAAVVQAALGSVGLSVDVEGKTQYLLYLGEQEIERIGRLCHDHWDTLVAATGPVSLDAPAARGARDAKRAGRQAVPKEVSDALRSILDGGRAADLALFGRMLADLPERNIDAACQVAHALSTNQVSVEFDYYTAVDDLKPEDTAGADMIGTVEFNSACFYRYANVDIDQLVRNLGGDFDLARQALKAFLQAAVDAVPTGKQNSMAAHNRPSFVMTVLRTGARCSLANAFVRPVRPAKEEGLIERSIAALDDYWGKLAAMYSDKDVAAVCVATLEPGVLRTLQPALVQGCAAVIDGTVAAALPGGGSA